MFTPRIACLSLAAAAMSVLMAGAAQGQSAKFDFDSAQPTLSVGQAVPFSQLVTSESGVGDFRAQFSSPWGHDFVIQTPTSLGLNIHMLDGNFLWPIRDGHKTLDLRFDRFMTSITLTFVTLDTPPMASDMHMTLYQDSTESTPVGDIVTQGTYGGYVKYPHGQVTYTTTGRPFDVVRLYLDAGAAAGFAIDSITVVADRCQADFDGDDSMMPSRLAVEDVFAYLNAWFACSYRADFNHDGVQDFADIFDFLNAWFAGCP